MNLLSLSSILPVQQLTPLVLQTHIEGYNLTNGQSVHNSNY